MFPDKYMQFLELEVSYELMTEERRTHVNACLLCSKFKVRYQWPQLSENRGKSVPRQFGCTFDSRESRCIESRL